MYVPPEHNFYLTQLSDLPNGVFFKLEDSKIESSAAKGPHFQFLTQKIAPNQWRVRFIHR